MALFQRSGTVRDFNGVVVSKATVKVVDGLTYSDTAPLSVIYADSAGLVPLANPFQADAAGQYLYWTNQGYYSEQISRPGYYSETNDGFFIGGLPGPTGPQGPIGPTGPQGAIGPQGIQGDPGAVVQLTYYRSNVTATAAQTLFTTPSYTLAVNGILVWQNGVLLVAGADYTETSTTSITLASGAALNDQMTFVTAQPVASSDTGVQVRLDLIDTVSPTKGAGMSGFLSSLAYAANTVGAFLNDLGTAAIGKGASLIGYLAPYTGAVARTQAQKNADTLTVTDTGAAVDGATNDASAVATAVSDAPIAGAVGVPNGLSYVGATRVPIPKGAQIQGPGMVKYVPSSVLGNRVQNAAGRDKLTWGSEYLYKFLGKFIAGTATTIRLSGDSPTAQSGQYSDQIISMLAQWPSITVTKAGFSGKNTSDWLSTYLAGDIAAAPDVLIWHWGMNDSPATSGISLATTESNLRTGLAAYRAAVPIGSGGVILMTPNACSDGTGGRDELRNEQIRQIIRNVAADFQCAYIDTYGLFQDGYIGIGNWIDNPYSDGLRGIHPGVAFAQGIAGEVLDVLIPKGIRRIAGEFGMSNSAGSVNPLTTDTPTTYPAGVSIRRATAANGWPNDGFVVTFFETSNHAYAFQINYPYYGTAQPCTRYYNNVPGWTAFNTILCGTNQGNFIGLVATNNTAIIALSRMATYGGAFEQQTAGVTRWRDYIFNDAERGADAGSSKALAAYTDAGALIDYPWYVLRAAGGLMTFGGTTKRPVLFTGFVANAVGATVASATSIAPTGSIFHVTGTTAIATITPPYTGFTGTIRIIPDGTFTTTTAGNISIASTAVVGKALEMTYDGTKWYPSY